MFLQRYRITVLSKGVRRLNSEVIVKPASFHRGSIFSKWHRWLSWWQKICRECKQVIKTRSFMLKNVRLTFSATSL